MLSLGNAAKRHEILEIVLRRNTNIPANVNAVSVLVLNPDGFSDEDCIQLGFLPRNGFLLCGIVASSDFLNIFFQKKPLQVL